jgi:hypothetical protein
MGDIKIHNNKTSPLVADQNNGSHISAVVVLDKDGAPVSFGGGGGGGGDASAANQELEIAELTAIKTSVQLIDDTVETHSGNKFLMMGGRHGSGAGAVKELAVDSNGDLQIDVKTSALPTGASTETTLTAINTKTPTLDNSKQPVIPSMTTGGNLSVQTNATGANFTAFASQACKQLTLSNQSGVMLEVQQGGAGIGLQLPNGTFYTFYGITNTNQLGVRRFDQSSSQVTVTARWEN